MLPLNHLILSTIFVILLSFLFPQISLIGLIIILASAVLIDVDHYIYYLFAEKDLSLTQAYKWFLLKRKKILKLKREERKLHKTYFLFLHGFESLIILSVLGKYVSHYFYFILIGFAFHLVLDIIAESFQGFKLRKLSAIYDFIQAHKKNL